MKGFAPQEWKPFKRVPNAQAIANGLKQIPSHWALTPLQDKSPKRQNWQTEDFVPHRQIEDLILNGERKTSKAGNDYTLYWSGYGLRTGEPSGGIIAIDVDGESAQPLLLAISQGDIPDTVSWSSGKPGRYQLAFQIPEETRPLLTNFNRKALTEWNGLQTARDEQGKPIELLEFRYNRCQSALPPSRHPTTGSYEWIASPVEAEVATSPTWLCELLVEFATEENQKRREREERVIRWTEFQQSGEVREGNVNLIDFLNFEVLPRLSVEQIFNWTGHKFRQYGKTLKGCPPWRQTSSGTSFHVWWDGQRWAWQDKAEGIGGNAVEYRWRLRGGYGTPKGKDFVDVVAELAADAGLCLPELPKYEPKKETETNSSTSNWAWQQWLNSRKFTPDITINQEHFSFPKGLPETNAVIAVKSGLGTRKTGAMLGEIKRSEGQGRGAKINGYRNNLLFQTISRGQELDVVIYHLREDEGHDFLPDKSIHQAFCLDSIHHVDGYFEGCDLYLDETCSVLLHAVGGGTLGDNQAKILKIFTHALKSSNRVILFDGNLSDLYVDFISRLTPEKKVVKTLNEQKIQSHTIKIIDTVDIKGEIKKRDKSPLIKFISQGDVIPFIFTDSKTQAKILTKILEKSGKRGITLHGENVGEEWAKKFLDNPDKFILENKPQFFIGSPSIESGVSITVENYFTHKFTFFSGVLSTNSQHQGMFRLRENIEHFVFCPERSTIKDPSNPKHYAVTKFKEVLNDRIVQSALLASQSADSPESVMEIIGKALMRQQDEWWEFACRLNALENFEKDNYRKCLVYALQDAGHNIEFVRADVDEIFKQEEKEAKEEVLQEHAHEMYVSEPFDSIEEAKEAKKKSPNKLTQRRIELTFLLDRIPGIKDEGVWSEDFILNYHLKQKDFITKHQRFVLINNFEIQQKRHEAQWFYHATREDFYSGRVKGRSHLILWALQELEIQKFTVTDKEWMKDSPELIELDQKFRERSDIQSALGYDNPPIEKADGSHRVPLLRTLLSTIGIDLKSAGRKLTSDGTRQRFYCVDTQKLNLPERLSVIKCIESSLKEWMDSEKSQVSWQIPEEEQITDISPAIAPVEVSPVVNIPSPPTLQETKLAELAKTEQAIAPVELATTEQADEWTREEAITYLTECLEMCETPEMLEEIRAIAPAEALKVAARNLPTEKRQLIREHQ